MTYVGQQLRTTTEAGATNKYFYTPEGNLSCVTSEAGVDSDCFAPTGWTPSSRLLEAYGYDYRNRVTSYRAFANGTETKRESTSYDALDRPVERGRPSVRRLDRVDRELQRRDERPVPQVASRGTPG